MGAGFPRVNAQEVGSLSLVLRKPGEQNNPVVETIAMNDLRYNMYGGARYPAPEAARTSAAPVPQGTQVAEPVVAARMGQWRAVQAAAVAKSDEVVARQDLRVDLAALRLAEAAES